LESRSLSANLSNFWALYKHEESFSNCAYTTVYVSRAPLGKPLQLLAPELEFINLNPIAVL
jgi:hypothetical protein